MLISLTVTYLSSFSYLLTYLVYFYSDYIMPFKFYIYPSFWRTEEQRAYISLIMESNVLLFFAYLLSA